MHHRTTPVALLTVVLAAACGGGGDEPPADGGDGADAASRCTEDSACDDGVFCNGVERCAPEAEGSDARGCVTEPPCMPGQTCNESERSCLTDCELGGDADGDGSAARECGGADCDDADPNAYPGNVEVCDAGGHDEDCDPTTLGDDGDGDGFVSSVCCNLQEDGSTACGADCNDSSMEVNPEASEICNARDDNCNGEVDEGLATSDWVRDCDGDGHGDVDGSATTACAMPSVEPDCEGDAPMAQWSTSADDCDDTDASVNPGTSETCNGVDDNCNGELDGPNEDNDGDGWAACDGLPSELLDCDDSDPDYHPGAPETCDTEDRNCDGLHADHDGDGQLATDETCTGGPRADLPRTDCDDERDDVYEGATEYCDLLDNDCDGSVDEEGYVDPGSPALWGDDYSCLGTGTLPTPGSDVAFTAQLDAHDTIDGLTEGVDVEIYSENEIPTSDCSVSSCTTHTTDFRSEIGLTLPEQSRFAYRIPETGDLVETIGQHVRVPSAGEERFPVLHSQPLSYGEAYVDEPGTTGVLVVVLDCSGAPVDDAVVRLYDDASPVCGSFDYRSGGSRWTGGGFSAGMVVVGDVPMPSDGDLTVEAWGRLDEGGALELLGREVIQVRENVLSALNLRPLKADSPSR